MQCILNPVVLFAASASPRWLKVIWRERDYCACVEAYDYYTTMHALFETLHIGQSHLRCDRDESVYIVQNPGVLVWIEHIDFKSLSFASLDYASSSLSILFHLSLLRPFSLAGKMENGWKWLRENQNKCFAWYIILKADRWHEDLQKTCKSDWLNVVLK